MSVTKDSLQEVRYYLRKIEFEGREPEPYVSYSHKGKQWVPDTARVRWDHGKPIKEISVGGRILKKDGTPSQNVGNIRYITPAHNGWGRGYDQHAPEWLLDLFADSPHTTPEGAAE